MAEDPHLSHALHRPNLDVRNVNDDLSAIAATMEGLSTRDLSKHEPRILLCIEPHRLTGLAECLEVLSTYVQELTLWVFDPSRFDVLRKVSQQELLAYRVQPTAPPIKPESVPQPEPLRKPKVDIHQAEMQRTVDVTTGPMLNIAQGQTAWAGPWGPDAPEQKPEQRPAEKVAENPAEIESSRTETWNPAHKLRLAGGEEETPASAPVAHVEPAPVSAQPPQIPVASLPPTPVPTNLQPAEPPSQEPLLTDEELAMLLGDDPRFSGQS